MVGALAMLLCLWSGSALAQTAWNPAVMNPSVVQPPVSAADVRPSGTSEASTSSDSHPMVGEVKTVMPDKYSEDRFLFIIESPFVIRINDATRYVDMRNNPVQIPMESARLGLKGRGVRVYKIKQKDGSYLAEKIVLLDEQELLKIREKQPSRTGKYIIKGKDALKPSERGLYRNMNP